MTSLPTPEQWVIQKMTLEETEEMLEEHIRFVDKDGNEVNCPDKFVRHFMKRDDDLPIVVAVSTLPLVFADGKVWAEDKFDRLRGIDYRIQPEVAACVPKPGNVTDDDVRKAMNFLTDEWLVDVATDYAGKCIIIAAALTLIERTLLDQRPTFWVTAGRRGSGKTTTIVMLIKAVTGIHPAASAWSSSEEERRKALLSYFMYGISYLLWDNIPRGTNIDCPHIEKSCTAAYYADRKLGVSETIATAASTIHVFTGNNIGPKGELASRSLVVTLSTNRHDPENKDFTHSDPIAWTDNMRAEILTAFYTILLGNPALKLPRDAPMKTRFKMWQRLVGSAVEHAAKLVTERLEPGTYDNDDPARPCQVDFKKLFFDTEAEDEETTHLGEFLDVLFDWQAELSGKAEFEASLLAEYINRDDHPSDSNEPARTEKGRALREFLYPDKPANQKMTVKSVGKRLTAYKDAPVLFGKDTMVLKCRRDSHANGTFFRAVKNPDSGN
jgi:hypothetical protein